MVAHWVISRREMGWGLLALCAAIANVLLPPEAIMLFALVGVCGFLALSSPLAMLVVALVLSPLRVLIATEAALDLPLDIGQGLLAVYMAVWLAGRIVARRSVFIGGGGVVFGSILVACAVFSVGAWTSESLSAWLREWLKWVVMAALVWQLSLSSGDDWGWLVFALVAAATANAIVGLYIFFGGSGADHLFILGKYFRAFGSFGQPNPFGGFMGLVLPLGLMGTYGQAALLLARHRRHRRIDWDALALLICFGGATGVIGAALLASWSRGAWLGTAAALAVMLFALPKRLSRGLACAVGLCILLGGMWLGGLLPQSVLSRLTSAAGDFLHIEDIRGVDISPTNYAVMERIAHWQAAVNMAERHPIFGIGLGNYEVVYEDYRLINWEEPLGHAHNHYLNMLAETGIIGLFAYLGLWVVIFGLTWGLRGHPHLFARCMGIALLGCWTYLAAHSMFDNLYVNNLFLHIGVLLGLLAILRGRFKGALALE